MCLVFSLTQGHRSSIELTRNILKRQNHALSIKFRLFLFSFFYQAELQTLCMRERLLTLIPKEMGMIVYLFLAKFFYYYYLLWFGLILFRTGISSNELKIGLIFTLNLLQFFSFYILFMPNSTQRPLSIISINFTAKSSRKFNII